MTRPKTKAGKRKAREWWVITDCEGVVQRVNTKRRYAGIGVVNLGVLNECRKPFRIIKVREVLAAKGRKGRKGK